jgi:hypothetical protein
VGLDTYLRRQIVKRRIEERYSSRPDPNFDPENYKSGDTARYLKQNSRSVLKKEGDKARR